MERKTQFFAIGIALAALGALALGCARPEHAPDTLVVAVESMPTNLDPRFATDATSSRIDDLVFRSLTRVNERLQHVPDIAVDWKSDSSLVVRFLLRPDATFSDGSRLTASDVRATYESVLDASTGSPKREDLAFLDAIEAPDDTTVVFRLRKPFAAYLQATTLGIVPRSALRAGRRVLVGAGPYRIERVVPGQEVTLKARTDHAGIREIRFRSIPDDTVRTLEMDQGNVDLSENAIEPDNLRWLEARERICVRRIPGTTFQYLGLNLDDPRLRDVRVRRAIAAAIDRKALVEYLLAGSARLASGLLPPEHWAYEAAVESHPYDPAAAKRLLDEAGYADPDGDGPKSRFRIGYKTTTLDSRRRLGEALQAMLADVGIGLDVRSFEWATFYDDIRHRRFELYSLAWVGIADPDFFYTLLQSTMTPPRGQNRGGYADPTVDRLVESGRDTMDPAARQRIYEAVQKRVAAELPFIPLWWTDNIVVHSKRLCGFAPKPDGSLDSLATARRPRSGRARGREPVRLSGPRMNSIVRRLLLVLPTLVGVATLVFFFIHLLPGDPVDAMLGENAEAVDRAALRAALGLDRPLWSQYATFVSGLTRGDLGRSLADGSPVASLVVRRLPATAVLALAAGLVALAIAIPLGTLSARHRGSWIDGGATAFALFGAAMPNFVLGPLLVLVFSVWLGWFPVSGADSAASLVLPATTLGLGMSAILTRLTRAAVLDALGADFVRTARAKGLSEARVFVRHALRSGLLPVATVFGLQLGGLLGGAIITETIFAWPGIGRLTLQAIDSRDYPLVQGCVLVIACGYVAANLVTDLAYRRLDPRVRLGGEGER